MGGETLESSIKPGKRGHLVGIGGVSMCSLAEVLESFGIIVSGSDLNENSAVRRFIEKGMKISIGHSSENIAGVDFIIRTAAAHDDNPEITAARETDVPVFERAQAWGYLMKAFKESVCVAGTHGKTSTTSMVTHIALEAGADPTVMIGGYLPVLGAGHRVGNGDLFIMEACEYCNSFLNFTPTVGLILNIEEDHLDFFKDLDDIILSFRKFAGLIPPDGILILNADNENTLKAAVQSCRVMTFSMKKPADVTARNLSYKGGFASFDVYNGNELYTRISMSAPGEHNASNALGAVAAAIALGLPSDAAARGIEAFHGAGRRFEFKGEYNGGRVYDDYAHHPSEVSATLKTARDLCGEGRVIIVFQPHTYSRTKALFDDFIRVLPAADMVILTEIYAAREQNTIGISSKDLAEKIPGSVFCPSFEEAEAFLRQTVRAGDMVITTGAGDIYKVGEILVK